MDTVAGKEAVAGGWLDQTMGPDQSDRARHLLGVRDTDFKLGRQASMTVGRLWPEAETFVAIAFTGKSEVHDAAERVDRGAGWISQTLESGGREALDAMAQPGSIVRGFDHWPTPEEVAEALEYVNGEGSMKQGFFSTEVSFVEFSPAEGQANFGVVDVESRMRQRVV